MISHIHHLNILVRDIDKACDYWQQLLQQAPIKGPLEGRGVLTARFKLGQSWLVLVSPVQASSPLSQLLEQGGEGMFLLSLATDNLAQERERLAAADVTACSDPRQGLENWYVQDISAPHMGLQVMQLCQEVQNEILDS